MTTLAIDGGPAHITEPLSPWPAFTESMAESVAEVVRSGKVNFWTGPHCRAFEEEYAAAIGVPHAIAVANGTLALELALIALEIGPGDEVIVPCRTFIASASAVVARGATPVVADVDPVSQNVTVETMAPLVGEKTRAILCVHLGGWPCEMPAIMEFAAERGLLVIEDCAQAHGASIGGRPVGSFGDAAGFSFCQDKIITTGGEGGLFACRDEAAYRRAWSYKDHGKSLAKIEAPSPGGGAFRWLHDSFGSNFRMTEMQAVIGREALRLLPGWIERRRENMEILKAAVADVPGVQVPEPPGHVYHAAYKCYFLFEPDCWVDGWDRTKFVLALQAEGVPCGSGSCSEIDREEAFGTIERPAIGDRSGARYLEPRSVMFQVHPTLTAAEVARVGEAIAKVASVAVRAGSGEVAERQAKAA